MTVQWSTAVRNGVNNAWPTAIGASAKVEIYSGSMPANCAASTTGTKLVEWDLASTWAGSSSGGVISLLSLPLSVTAVGGSPTNAGYYRIFDFAGTTCHEQGTVTATGGGGDLTCDNISITTGQTVNLTGFSKTAPGA